MDAAQLAERIHYLGSSDAAAVLGLSRWSSPLQVWAEKTGQIPPHEANGEAVELGAYLEEYVARRFSRETGLKVRRVNERQIHPKHPFLVAQIDRMVVGDDSLCECKTASAWKAKEWEGEEIPKEYIIQVLHQLAVTGKRLGYIAVLIGNQDFKWKKIERDEKLIGEIITREVSFWNDFVIPKVMPATITAQDASTLYALYPLQEPGTEIDLGDEAVKLFESRQSLLADMGTVKANLDLVDNEIKALLKDKELGRAGKWVCTWKSQTRKAYSVAESITRVLRVKENHNGNGQ